MAAKKKLTPQQQRDRRSKIMLGVLGAVLLLVLAIQLPKFMKGSGASAAAPPAATTTSAPTGAPSVLATAPTQLQSFTRFAPKDPFKAKVKVAGAASPSTPAGSAPPTATPPAAKPKKATPPPAPPIKFTLQPTQTVAAPTGPMVPAAMITVDHKKIVIPLGGAYPQTKPVFRVVGLSADTVVLRLIGGTFANGSPTLKLKRGHPVTLLNATIGTRLVLAMVKPTTAPPPPPAPTTTAATTTAPAATTPTTTTPTTTTTG